MAPMCTYEATEEGFPTSFHTIHYATRSIGGVGLIILEATAIESRGRISSRDLGIWDDAHIDGLKKLVSEIKKYGAKVGVQLAHAGRKCGVLGEESISCSPNAFSEKYKEPKEMKHEDILDVVESFKKGAKRALDAGFNTIEIHAAHGYLINQFLSPLTNKRQDEYGGSIENRARFLKEVISAIKTIWPNELPIMIRVSAEEFKKEGNHPEDLIQIINLIKDEGIDIIDVSSGGVVSDASIYPYPGYQLSYAEKIKNGTKRFTVCGGLVTTPEMAEEIVQNDRSDLVFFGRELLRNPYFPLQAADKLKAEIDWPTPYQRGKI